jgi:hypothetical protein
VVGAEEGPAVPDRELAQARSDKNVVLMKAMRVIEAMNLLIKKGQRMP